VLYGRDGATAAECAELQGVLHDFKASAELLGQSAHFADLIADCERHYPAYRCWLEEGRPLGSYKQYLEESGREGA